MALTLKNNMKLLAFFAAAILALYVLPVFVHADSGSGIPSSYQAIANAGSNLGNVGQPASSGNWSSLALSFRQNLLASPFVTAANSFFMAINPVFLVLMGQQYSFSLEFLFALVIWVFLFFQFRRIFGLVSILSKWVRLIISFGLVTLLSQLGLFRAIALGLSNLVFSPASPIVGVIVLAAVVLGMFFIATIDKWIEKAFNKSYRKHKEELDKLQEKLDRSVLDTYVGGLKKGFEGKGNK